MSEYTRIKSELDCWYHCFFSNPKWESYINAEDVKALIGITEKQREAIDIMISYISMGRKGYCGDHVVYVVQIHEKTVNQWREILKLTEE